MNLTRRQLKNLISEELESYSSQDIVEVGLVDRAKSAWDEWMRGTDTGDTSSIDVGDTGDTGHKDLGADEDPDGVDEDPVPDAIEYHPNLPFSKGTTMRRDKEEKLKKGLEARYLYSCDVDQCAEYVSETLNKYQGNAWHAHTYTDPTLDSAFNDNVKIEWIQHALARVFGLLNRKSGGTTEDNKYVKRVVRKMLPDQSRWSGLQIGDIVGLYHPGSSYHHRAFFEGATGTAIGEKGERESVSGTFFINMKTGQPWQASDMGKNITFVPGKTLKSGKSFGMNTHIGFVGASYRGEPIIFHNIYSVVTATPLRAMGDKDYIVWSKKSKDTISESKTSAYPKLITLLNEATEPLGLSLKEALEKIKLVHKRISKSLGITHQEFLLFLTIAIILGKRESGLGTGGRYVTTNWLEVIGAEINKSWKDWTGGGDIPLPQVGALKGKTLGTSTGPTQIKWGTAEKDLPPEYSKEIGVTRPHDLSDLGKSLLAAVGILVQYYNRAKAIGLSTTNPGVNDGYEWISSGNAAIDMAVAAYNGGPGKISNFCGTEKLKKKCARRAYDRVEDYIPASGRFGMSYVSDITSQIDDQLKVVKAFFVETQ